MLCLKQHCPHVTMAHTVWSSRLYFLSRKRKRKGYIFCVSFYKRILHAAIHYTYIFQDLVLVSAICVLVFFLDHQRHIHSEKNLSFCFSVLQIIGHIDKISTFRKCSFVSAASDIFRVKISGTFKRFCLPVSSQCSYLGWWLIVSVHIFNVYIGYAGLKFRAYPII